jgi:hypothetical protein
VLDLDADPSNHTLTEGVPPRQVRNLTSERSRSRPPRRVTSSASRTWPSSRTRTTSR